MLRDRGYRAWSVEMLIDSRTASFMATAIVARLWDQLFCLGLTKFLFRCLRVHILHST